MLKNKQTPKRRWLDLAPGDPVVVTAGKDKGKTGEVLRTIPDQHKIVVKGRARALLSAAIAASRTSV
jgi:large subunit ribosomal protein L24